MSFFICCNDSAKEIDKELKASEKSFSSFITGLCWGHLDWIPIKPMLCMHDIRLQIREIFEDLD